MLAKAFAYPTQEERTDPTLAGMNPDLIDRAIEVFRRQQATGLFPGGQLVVRRHGQLVVDEAVGIARGFRSEEKGPRVAFARDVRSSVCSAGKPLVAVAIALLEYRGIVDVDRPVAFYWPEFGRHGK